jgi:hypothetical protein
VYTNWLHILDQLVCFVCCVLLFILLLLVQFIDCLQLAREIFEQWTNARSNNNIINNKSTSVQLEWTSVKRSDITKGVERVGRQLAQHYHLKWMEVWCVCLCVCVCVYMCACV